MKKLIITIQAVLFSVTIFAQETDTAFFTENTSTLTNKKGMLILPVSGDFALGVSADPFLNYLGNIFNNTANNSLNLSSYNIYGKYYLTSTSALRLRLRIDESFDVDRNYVSDDAAVFADPLSREKTVDKRNRYNSATGIFLGYQKYRGYGRLQGYYGAGLGYSRSRTVYEYQYGNSITETNQAPTSSTWNGTAQLSERLLRQDYGLTQSVQGGIYCGVEFFFAPKISVGAEAGLIYNHAWSSESDAKHERWENGRVREIIYENTPGDLERDLETNGLGTNGAIFLFFHF